MIQFVPISAAYAGVLALVLIALSWRVVIMRRRFKVGMGDEGHEPLGCAIRSHANFTEYVPICLILIVLLELNGATETVLHVLGSTLVVARVIHAWGLGKNKGLSFGRYYGTAATWGVLLVGAVLNLYVAFY